MKKDKDSKQEIYITDQQKNDHPIYNAIYKRIKNLNKKLGAIQELQKMKANELNQQQLKKIERKTQIESQIKKNEQFAIFYKDLLIQNSLKYDKTQDLIRISTLIAVGNHIKQNEYCPKQTVEAYHTYNKLMNSHKFDHLADSVTHIYRILNKYLTDQKSYTGCRDYMTYLPQIKIEAEDHKKSKLLKDPHPQNQSFTQKAIQKQKIVEEKKVMSEQKPALTIPITTKEDLSVQNIVKLQQKQQQKQQKHQNKQYQQNPYPKANNRRKNNHKTQYRSKNDDNYYQKEEFREPTPKKKKIMYKQKV